MINDLDGIRPLIHENAFVHERAVVIGEVAIGEYSSVWPGAILRGDMGAIKIGARTSIQDGAIGHMTSGLSSLMIGDEVTIGHGAILHGVVIESRCLIGMGAILLDNAIIGEGSFVAAGSLVTPHAVIPPGSFVVGSPAKVLRKVSEREMLMILEGSNNYVELIKKYQRANHE